MASAKQKAAARKNIKKAQAALRRKKRGAHRPKRRKNPESKRTRSAAAKKGHRNAKRRHSGGKRRRKNPSGHAMMVAGGSPIMRHTNPGKRKKRRKNPASSVLQVLGQAALATGGVLTGIGLARLADMYIPVGNGALAGIEAGAAFVLGGVTYFLSPAAAVGLFGGLGGSAGSKTLDLLLPAKSASPPSSSAPATPPATSGLGMVQIAPGMKLVAKNGQQAMGRIELAMGAVELVPDGVQNLGAVQIRRPNVMVSGAEVDRRLVSRGY